MVRSSRHVLMMTFQQPSFWFQFGLKKYKLYIDTRCREEISNASRCQRRFRGRTAQGVFVALGEGVMERSSKRTGTCHWKGHAFLCTSLDYGWYKKAEDRHRHAWNLFEQTNNSVLGGAERILDFGADEIRGRGTLKEPSLTLSTCFKSLVILTIFKYSIYSIYYLFH